jgi:Domain of unknown function (DUF4432)
METRTHLLLDTGAAIVADREEIRSSRAASGGAGWRVRMHTCRGGRSEGVQVVELDNGRITLDVLPTRGMGIWRVRRGPSPNASARRGRDREGATLGWRSPVRGPVHPSFVPLFDPSGLGWLEGFDELLCRCGLTSNGAPDFDASGRLLYPLHGRIANLPAHRVELDIDEDAGRLTLRGVIEETRFHFPSLRLTTTYTTGFDSNEFQWTDEVENVGGREATMQLLYHFNLGQPLLRPGARIIAPVGAVAPWTKAAADAGVEDWHTMPPPRTGSTEQGYLLDLLADDAGESRVMVSGLADDEAIGLRFNRRSLPYFTVWRNTPAEIDGYVMGLEPATNFPNPHSFEKRQGRVVTLKPGETWCGDVAVVWHTDAESIRREAAAIRAIQGERESVVHEKPCSEWSAGV